MKLEIDKVPPKGYVYFVGDKLFFSAYSVADGHAVLSDGRDVFSWGDVSEIHFFDDKTEYRVLCDGNNVRTFLLTEADDVNNPNYVTIREDMWIRPEFCPSVAEFRISVVNRFEYTDDDRLCLTGYRLSSID